MRHQQRCPAHNLLSSKAWWSWTGEHLAVGVHFGITQFFSGLPVLLGTEPICRYSRQPWMGLQPPVLTVSQKAVMHVHWRHSEQRAAPVCCLTGSGLGKDEHGDVKQVAAGTLTRHRGPRVPHFEAPQISEHEVGEGALLLLLRGRRCRERPSPPGPQPPGPTAHQGRGSHRAPQQQTRCSPY